MIEGLIENYGDVGALGAFVLLMIWYVRFQTKQQTKREDKSDEERAIREEKHDEQQKEERNYYRGLIKDELKKNAVLNTKSLVLQKGMMKDLEKHNGHSEEFSEKVIETLSLQTDAITLVCNKLNGESPDIVTAKERLNKDRRQKVEKVRMDRRK